RDIIIGELSRRYNPKMLALRKASARFWETQERRIRTTFEEDMIRERMARELEREKSRTVQDLFGYSFEDYLADGSARSDRHADLVDRIAPESRSRAREVLRKYDQLEHELIERGNGTLGKLEMEELRRAFYRKRAEMKAFLSHAEMEEFELRASPIAEDLRNRELVGFSPTEEEFRTIFRIRRDLEEGLGENPLPQNDGEIADIDQMRNSLEKRLRDALGESRYADYQRSQDFAYRRLVELTDHFGLPNEPAIAVHELRLEAFREINSLSENPTVNLQTRQSVLRELQTEVRRNAAAALGDEVFAAYLTSPWGNWMEQIGEWTNGVVLRQLR
ncbi:MAG: hypothetical protein L0Z50_34805, partial [Verrucomicrobiales bacterium]|nr:hypothetical protein [Verrucomicrobiales bacterium]